MLKQELIKKVEDFLFSDAKEMAAAGLGAAEQNRLLRIRAEYTYWLNFPRLSDRDIVLDIQQKYHVGQSVAYEDVRLIKRCLGHLNQVTKDYDRYRFRQMCEEGIEMARRQKDPNAFARIMAAYGKYTQLDKNEADAPSYSEITVGELEVTDDVAVIGFKPIQGARDLAVKWEKKLIREYEMVGDYAEFEELKAEVDGTGKP